MKIFANDNFKMQRIINGFTIVDLAAEVGVTKQALGQLERGANGVSPANALKITKALGVEFHDVFKFVERKQVDNYEKVQ
jgi:DNA-binding XRE family transcriptional regulator